MILSTFPQVIRLELRNSVLPDLRAVASSGLTVVENVNLSGCQLLHWEDAAWICSLPNLNTLKLCSNPLTAFPVPRPDVIEPFFPKLRMMNIEETALDSLTSLSDLSTYPNLTDLRVTKTPLAYRFGEDFRMLVIAYLPMIQHLNGGEVDEEERVSLERNFVREFARESGAEEHYREGEGEGLAALLKPEEYPINTSTFQRLFSLHGPVFKFASIDLSPPTSLTLTLQHPPNSLTLDFPLTLTISELKFLCHERFNVPLRQLKLYKKLGNVYTSPLEPEGAPLSAFRLLDGDIVLVGAKTEAAVTKGKGR